MVDSGKIKFGVHVHFGGIVGEPKGGLSEGRLAASADWW